MLRLLAVFAAGVALLVVGCGGSASDQMVRTAPSPVHNRDDGRLASNPAPLTISDVQKQPAGSPQQTVTRLIFWAQWGNLPAVVDLYDGRVVARVGRSRIAGSYDFLRPDLLTSTLHIVATRTSGNGVFVSAELASTSGPPRQGGFLVIRRNGVWRVAYDTLLERAIEGFTIARLAPGDPTPSPATLRIAARAAERYRDAYSSLPAR